MGKKSQQVISRFFTHQSGPSGGDDENMNPTAGTGTPAPAVYAVVVPAKTRFLITRVHLLIKDLNCKIGKFGGLSALANGMKVEAINSDGTTVDIDFLDGKTIKMNEDFDWLAGVDVPFIANTAAADAVPVRWTLTRDLNDELELVPGASLRLTMQDDLSGLTEFRAIAKGFTVAG